MNGEKPHPVFREKNLFNDKFFDYIKRDWVYMKDATEDDFISFCKNNTTYIEKPVDSWNGKGVQKKNISPETDLRELFKEYSGKPLILEEYLTACELMQKLHPASLNTIRVATVLNEKNDEAKVVAAVLRIGSGNNIVDNLNSGGLCAAIDLERGTVSHKAVNLKGERYEYHPDTNARITGLMIPEWQSIIEMCKAAAIKCKEVRFVGWDVAVTFNAQTNCNKIQLIEGNDRQDFPLLQMSSGKGLMHENVL